jgi:hypothetical protein
MIALILAGHANGAPQEQTSTDTKLLLYFPSEADGTGSFFAVNLRAYGEPSLLDAARSPDAHSYRLNWQSGSRNKSLFVRLSLDREGKGEIIIIENPMSPKSSRTLHRTAQGIDVAKFLEMVQKSDFWAMPPTENVSNDTHEYKMDAGMWLFEGVRESRYHFVYRLGPTASPFTEMVHFLTKDLAGVDERASPHPFGVSHGSAARPK